MIGIQKGTCPACSKPASIASDNSWRPFCSQRCKLKDLGDWFAERYVIPADDEPPPDTGAGRSQ